MLLLNEGVYIYIHFQMFPVCKPHTRMYTHTPTHWILSQQTQGHQRHRGGLMGVSFGMVQASESGGIGPSSCILQYPQGLSLMPVHASEPGTQNKVTELCSYCRHSWNYLCKFSSESEPVNTNGEWWRELQQPGGGDAGGSGWVWIDIKERKFPLGFLFC